MHIHAYGHSCILLPPCRCLQGEANTTPQRVRATITSGSLKAFGRDFGLPISGKGDFEILFCDGTIRIFRSTGSLAVQVRADKL